MRTAYKKEATNRIRLMLGATLVVLLAVAGCAKPEKEKEPEVSGQKTPAQRASIAQTVSADAGVFPLEQATGAPKITSTVKRFLVRRGARVEKGNLLAGVGK